MTERSAQCKASRPRSGQPATLQAAVEEATRLKKLADDPGFLRDCAALDLETQALGPLIDDEASWEAAWPDFAERHVRPFVRKWRALPLSDPDTIAPDARRAPALAIAAGRWGVITMFPWTTQQEVLSRFRKLRQVIGQHQATRDGRVGLARWMATNGVPHAAIAAVVWGKTRGLRRLSTRAAIARLSADREKELMNRFLAHGLPWEDAERATIRRARGAEPRAAAQVRMAVKRDRKDSQRLTRELVLSEQRDPLGSLIAALIRKDTDPQMMPQRLAELRSFLTK